MSTKEDGVQNALKRFEQKEFRSIRQTALATTQARSTLGHRRAGRLPRSEITVRNARLTKQQREILFRYIRDLQLQFQPPNHRQIYLIAQKLADQSNPSLPLGKHWVTRFLKSEPDLAAGQSIPFSIDRVTAPSPLHIERWFDYL